MTTINALLCAALLWAAPQSTPDAGGDEPGFTTLPNGLRYQCVHVPGSRGACVVLGVRVGTDHDPAGQTGLAAAGAEVLRLWQAAVPAPERLQVALRGPATLLATTVERGRLTDALATLRPVLDGELVVSDDMAHRARARAALNADGESKIFPGPMLELMARRVLLESTPAGRQTCGIPAELVAISNAAVRSWIHGYFRPRHAVLVVLSGWPARDMEAAVEAACADLSSGDTVAPVAAVHDSLGPVVSPAVHDRVNGPFVTLALPAPASDSPDLAAFLIAMSAVRGRAARALLEPRGGEVMARFPPMQYADDEGARLVMINRRGRDGEGMEPAQGELERFVDGMRGSRVSAEEIRRAATEVAERLEQPPYREETARLLWNARALYPRAMVLATADILGWPADLAKRIRATPPERVQAVLDAALAPGDRCWLALTPPAPRAPIH